MRNKLVTLMLGASLSAALLTGCDMIKDNWREAPDIEVMDVEVVTEEDTERSPEPADLSSDETKGEDETGEGAEQGVPGSGEEDKPDSSFTASNSFQGGSGETEEVILAEPDTEGADAPSDRMKPKNAGEEEPDTEVILFEEESAQESETLPAQSTAQRKNASSADAAAETIQTDESSQDTDDQKEETAPGYNGGTRKPAGQTDARSQGGQSTQTENPSPASQGAQTDNRSQGSQSAQTENPSPVGQDAQTDNWSQGGPSVQTEAQSQGGSSVQTEARSQGGSSIQTEARSQGDLSVQTEARSQGGSSVQTEARSQGGLSIQTEARSQGGSSIQTERQGQETGTEDVQESGSELENSRQSESESESESSRQSESESESESNRQRESESESESSRQRESESESESNRQRESELESEKKRIRESESESESNRLRESESESESERLLESERESERIRESESESESESEAERKRVKLGVVAERVNVRQDVSTESESLAVLKAGDKLIILETRDDGWLKVSFEDEAGIQSGYMKEEYVFLASQLRRAKERVNIRKEADTEAEKLGTLDAGEEILVVEEGEWSEVIYTKDSETVHAFVKAEYLEEFDYLDSQENIIAEYKRLVDEQSGGAASSEEMSESGDKEEPSAPAGQSEILPEETDPETESSAQTEETAEEEQAFDEELPKDPIAAQFYLAKKLVPELSTLGILYTEGNSGSDALVSTYKDQAAKEGVEIQTVTIKEAEDIDFAASDLVGSVDGILLIDDPIVGGLTETVVAYADEVGIPVIGFDRKQVKRGSAAAAADGKIYLNRKELDKLGIDPGFGKGEQVKEL